MDEAAAEFLGAYAKTYMAGNKKSSHKDSRWNTFIMGFLALIIPLLPKLFAYLRDLVAKMQEWLSPETDENISLSSSSTDTDTDEDEPAPISPPSSGAEAVFVDKILSIFGQQFKKTPTTKSEDEQDGIPVSNWPDVKSTTSKLFASGIPVSTLLFADDSNIFDEVETVIPKKPAPNVTSRTIFSTPVDANEPNGDVDIMCEISSHKPASSYIYVWRRYVNGKAVVVRKKTIVKKLTKPAVKRLFREWKGEMNDSPLPM